MRRVHITHRSTEEEKGYLMKRLVLTVAFMTLFVSLGVWAGERGAPEGWTTAAPRDEIRPQFVYDAQGGVSRGGCFIIRADQREGLDGCWRRTFPIRGGKYYYFETLYKASGVAVARRSIVVKINWQNDQGRSVRLDEQPVTSYLRGATAMAETEFPTPKEKKRAVPRFFCTRSITSMSLPT